MADVLVHRVGDQVGVNFDAGHDLVRRGRANVAQARSRCADQDDPPSQLIDGNSASQHIPKRYVGEAVAWASIADKRGQFPVYGQGERPHLQRLDTPIAVSLADHGRNGLAAKQSADHCRAEAFIIAAAIGNEQRDAADDPVLVCDRVNLARNGRALK